MVSFAGGHHHRSTTKHAHKSFKSRHATKGALKSQAKGKVDDNSGRKTPHQQIMSKLERRNQARQIAANKHKDVLNAGKIFDGRRGAARIIAVIPLCASGSSKFAVEQLNTSLDISVPVPDSGLLNVGVGRFKQKLQYLIPSNRDFLPVLDACKIADFVVFILSASEEVDSHGEALIRAIESQGVSNVVTVVQHLDTVEPAKRRPDVKKSLLSYIRHFFPTQEKVYSLDALLETQNVLRSLCTLNPKGVRWRDSRSYMVVEKIWYDDNEGLSLGGTVRGKGLKADRLVHLQEYGDFQIEKICVWSEETTSNSEDAMVVDGENTNASAKILETPSPNQDDLNELAPEEHSMKDIGDDNMSMVSAPEKGVLLDDHHYFDDKEDEAYTRPRRLPKGTSDYQAAWILDSDFEESDFEDDDENGNDEMQVDNGEDTRPEDGEEGLVGESKSTYAPTEFEDDKSEMFLDPSPDQEAEEIQAFRNRQKDAEEDLEFPDEIELAPNVLARERLARYRGLKSLRTSKWETMPDIPHQPAHWNRLVRIENYKGMKSKILSEALVSGVPAGSRVRIYLRNAPAAIAQQATTLSVFSLLRHEHKRAVCNFSVLPSTDLDLSLSPIRAKDALLLQYGPRRMIVRPLFSTATNTPNNVHKFEQYLHPARSSIATVIAPLAWGNVPALFFRITDGSKTPELVGTGSFVSAGDNDRVIAKRVVLTGHPFKIHKKLVTVRFMFFNREDVNWYKAVPIYTKRGRSGYIKESLGTHGWFKATFDGKINPQDAVAMSLYKRVFPRDAEEYKESLV